MRIKAILIEALPCARHQIESVPNLDVNAYSSVKISLMQKAIFYFRMRLAEFPKDIVASEFVAGTEGRCPDGQNSFFDAHLAEIRLRQMLSDFQHPGQLVHACVGWK